MNLNQENILGAPHSGLIYSKIYTYRKQNNSYAESQWWAKLTPAKRDILNRLFENNSLNYTLSRFLSIPALLLDFYPTIWHKIIALKILPVSIVLVIIGKYIILKVNRRFKTI
jgi:hypothetical protein